MFIRILNKKCSPNRKMMRNNYLVQLLRRIKMQLKFFKARLIEKKKIKNRNNHKFSLRTLKDLFPKMLGKHQKKLDQEYMIYQKIRENKASMFKVISLIRKVE